MTEKVYIYDLSGNLIYDPEKASDRAVAIQWETMWPKGFGVCSFQVRRADLFADWVVSESYGVKIFDGTTIVYQGRIETLSRSMSGSDEFIRVQCIGWFVVLEERHIRKRWIDINATKRLRWPDSLVNFGGPTDGYRFTSNDTIQHSLVANKRENLMQVFMGTGDVDRDRYQVYREVYELPPNTYVRKVFFDWIMRSGENFLLIIFNPEAPNSPSDNPKEWQERTQSWVRSGSASILFSLGSTDNFEINWLVDRSDRYDQNDYAHVKDLRVEAHLEATNSAYASPTYSQGEIVEDVLILVDNKGSQLSGDYDEIADPGYILDPFVVEEPKPAMAVIEEIASYGDASLNTYGLCVWSETGTTDSLPKVSFEARDVSDYDYQFRLNDEELRSLNYQKISSQLFNNVIVQYENERDELRYRDSDDNAGLQDTDSIAAEYQRDYYIKLGQADTTRTDYVGGRFIEYHKDRLTQATFSVQDKIQHKSGNWVPVNRVRAGERIKLLNTGEIFFIRHTRYDVESKTLQISPDLPRDNLQMERAQVGRGFG